MRDNINTLRTTMGRTHALRALALGAAVAVTVGASACGGGESEQASGDSVASSSEVLETPRSIPIEQPTHAELAAAGLAQLPLAPESERIDLEAAPFTNPTEITNPLFPISDLQSVVLSGRVDGKPFHTETTLLPETRFIEVADGEVVEAAVSQYAAFLDGRIEEVALDYYAQADDGSVWYLGEDVNDYNEDGLIDGTEGTWLAGREGPPEMIMPADPQVGDVHRAENIPAIAFEEVEVKSIDETVDGPTGPVQDALVAAELHDDGSYSDKTFAPGYGEFFSAHEGDVEAMALAVPTDALGGSPAAELELLSNEGQAVAEAAVAGSWGPAAAGLEQITKAWDDYRGGDVPPRIAGEMSRAVDNLSAGIDARDVAEAGNGAIDVAQSALDLELRHLPPAEIDLARFGLWTQQILVDAAAGDSGAVNGDIATMEWVRDRFAQAIDRADLTRIDTHILVLRGSVVDQEPKAAEAEAKRLLGTLAGVEVG